MQTLKISQELAASTDAVLLQDETGAFVDCNQAALDLMKMTREQFTNMTPDQISVEFQPNGRRSEEYALEMTALGRKGFHRYEWTCKNLEGGEFVVEVSLMPITVKGREMLHCTWRDITERKRIDAELRESETTFRNLLEASADAILLQDETAAFVDCNQAALDLMKMTREQFINMTPDQISVEFQPNGRRSEEYAPEMTALGRKGFHRFEWTCKNLEGGEFVVEVSLMPITVKGREMLHCTWRDITERIDRQNQLAEMSSENARLLAEQQRVADTLQDAFLSMPDSIPSIDFDHLYRASSDIARVGGDFYDLFELDDQRVGVLLGDVSGHGLQATHFTAMVRNSIRAYLFDGASAAHALQKTNQLLIARHQERIFVTVWCGILDRESGTLQYCNAGHPPAIVRRKNGRTETIAEHSMMLGAIPGVPFSEHQTHLEMDDTLILYSDGVTEAKLKPGTELFSEEGLFKLVKELPTAVVSAIAPAILSEILGYTGGRLADDVAILALARKRSEA